jgi:hypothetical protein
MSSAELLGAGFFSQRRGFGSQLQQALLVDVLDHRDQQAIRGVHGEADVHVLLADDRLAAWRQRAVEVRQFLEQVRAGLEQQRQHGQLDAGLLGDGFLRNAEASSSVMSAESNWVTCGTFSQLRCRLARRPASGGSSALLRFRRTAEVDRDRRDACATGGAGGGRASLAFCIMALT